MSMSIVELLFLEGLRGWGLEIAEGGAIWGWREALSEGVPLPPGLCFIYEY
jgi:hypothetical protein